MPLPVQAVKPIVSQKQLTLRGSAALVKEFLHYGFNNILYLRGVVPHNEFDRVNFNGLDLFVSKNGHDVRYFERILNDLENFMADKSISHVILALQNRKTEEYLEEWEFKVNYESKDSDENSTSSTGKKSKYGLKDPVDIKNEMRVILRQIFGSSVLLPVLEEENLTFEIQVRMMRGYPTPPGWGSCKNDQTIANVEELDMGSFSTSVHAIHTKVKYKGV